MLHPPSVRSGGLPSRSLFTSSTNCQPILDVSVLTTCYFCFRNFGTKCARCGRSIHANDWVRRAKTSVYHLACFACDSCKRQLSTGEEFALKDGHVLCKLHYLEILERSTADRETEDG